MFYTNSEGATSQEEGYDKTFTFLKTQYISVKLTNSEYAELILEARNSFIAAMSGADFRSSADYLASIYRWGRGRGNAGGGG